MTQENVLISSGHLLGSFLFAGLDVNSPALLDVATTIADKSTVAERAFFDLAQCVVHAVALYAAVGAVFPADLGVRLRSESNATLLFDEGLVVILIGIFDAEFTGHGLLGTFCSPRITRREFDFTERTFAFFTHR